MKLSTNTPWLLVVALLLSGCSKPAEEARSVGKDFTVERLFEHDGCTAYRFMDQRYVYYVRCNDGRVSTQSRYAVPAGKVVMTKEQHTITEENK